MTAQVVAAPEQHSAFPESLELALLAFHRTIGPIRKQSDAKYGKFADLHTVLEAVTPVLIEQGLLLTQTITEADGGSCLLITELIHAPTGDKLSSACPIPTLQQLLERVHQLRGEVLSSFPLDLQLAAIGALPPVLPPRNVAPPGAPSGATPSAELPPPPPRQPGLRIEDQIKGLYTLLGQLGTTTNPLHGFGGIITYLRRYQVLSILSLAASDDDGESFTAANGNGAQADRSQQSQHAPQDPPPPRSRSRRTTAPKPQPTPPPQPAASQADQLPAQQQPVPATQPAPQPTSQPAPQPAPQADPKAAAPPAAANGSGDHALTPAEVQQLIALIRTLPTEKVPHLVAGFRQQFQLPSSALVSDYIKTAAHALFIRQHVDALKPAQAGL
ncbi:ERF family protein [Cyanobium sp. ATX 6A2]|uniref:ERF family protein n=1 Tax=Cyanobium sp. ATX 6A2 TaxID=2823700 RepID=UPI0020CE3D82|nr:ERF family protein [Cyanobium sp. ATX 6A2]MCP9889069.1 ERF family protein [Cyanobium sp. ATX 6A2]